MQKLEIGPCRDGGFVLFGSKRLIKKSIWTNVTYSREDTLNQLISLLEESDYRYHYISALGDVDHPKDLLFLLNDFLIMGAKNLPRQAYLYEWIKKDLIAKILQ